jgi:Zn-dependent protease
LRIAYGSLIQTIAIAAAAGDPCDHPARGGAWLCGRHFGDPTAWQEGRITANPLKHIDPVGTILVPASSCCCHRRHSCSAGPSRCRSISAACASEARHAVGGRGRPGGQPRDAAVLGGAAEAGLAAAAQLLQPADGAMAEIGMSINLVLMVLNLFPLPPLDGGRIAVSLLPRRHGLALCQLERFGFPILLLLLFTGILGIILLTPVMRLVGGLVAVLFQLPS